MVVLLAWNGTRRVRLVPENEVTLMAPAGESPAPSFLVRRSRANKSDRVDLPSLSLNLS